MLTEFAVALSSVMFPYETSSKLVTLYGSRPSTSNVRGLRPSQREFSSMPDSSPAASANGLKVEPACGADWVASLNWRAW